MARPAYVADLPGGTATTSVQIQANDTIKFIQLSMVAAAAGSVEVSLSGSSQIGTAQPTADVICRMRLSATAAQIVMLAPVNVPVKAFQTVYIHQTGAGNVGEVNLLT